MSTDGLKLFRAEALEHQRRRLAGEVVISLTARNQRLLALYLVVLGGLLLAASLASFSVAGECATPPNQTPAASQACRPAQTVRPLQTILGRLRLVSGDMHRSDGRGHR